MADHALGPLWEQADELGERRQEVEETLEELAALREVLPPSHRDGPWTEVVAAVRASEYAPTQRIRVLAYLVEVGDRGATDWEGAEELGMLRTSYGARRNTLMQHGLVEDTGDTRPGPYGSPNIVWAATARARRAARRVADGGSGA